MLSLVKPKLLVLLAVGLSIASAAPVASAAKKSFTLSVVPKFSMIQPGNNIVEDFTVTNKTSSSATCDLYVEEINFDIPLGTIAAGTSAGGQLSTPAMGKVTKLTFNLSCDGSFIASQSTVTLTK